ncbi:hypothetical protein N5079_15775 [Planotetraspora sp. A-T 1434]|uniref:hypothetical protein n=1 Tax=Planotetraspora sp. A-T 1434 TaxID=2979219 RepID=UPI0021C10143|nr:hypothetical protein [Planotetraspora sp. A-T 1434]MCT9931673.1 hypothetical protein [Planotetraspora sp. A-T 1434]
MNDDDVLGTVRDAMAGVHMHTPVQKLVAAGRSRRRRRIGGAAAGAALATGLALTLAIDSPQVNAPPVVTGNQVHVHLAAFSVDTNPDGTVTVKMTKQQSLDPEVMQRTLAQAGIPAQITINKWCEPSTASQDLGADFEKVVRMENSNKGIRRENSEESIRKENSKEAIRKEKQPDTTPWMVITPSAMPPATKLIIGMRTADYQPDSPSRVAVSMGLVLDDAPLTCTTDVPSGPAREPKPSKS